MVNRLEQLTVGNPHGGYSKHLQSTITVSIASRSARQGMPILAVNFEGNRMIGEIEIKNITSNGVLWQVGYAYLIERFACLLFWLGFAATKHIGADGRCPLDAFACARTCRPFLCASCFCFKRLATNATGFYNAAALICAHACIGTVVARSAWKSLERHSTSLARQCDLRFTGCCIACLGAVLSQMSAGRLLIKELSALLAPQLNTRAKLHTLRGMQACAGAKSLPLINCGKWLAAMSAYLIVGRFCHTTYYNSKGLIPQQKAVNGPLTR